MPDKQVSPHSVGKAVVSFFRPLVVAGLVATSAALLAVGCTDESGNGHFVPPGIDAAAGAAGGEGGGGGDSTGGTGGDTGAGGTTGTGGDGAGGAAGNGAGGDGAGGT